MVGGINQKIKKLRLERGLTLQRLSELCGFSKGYLSRIEASSAAPRLPTLQKIARAFDIDVSSFFEQSAATGKKLDIDLLVRRASGPSAAVKTNADYSYEPLVHNYRDKYMAPYLLRIPKGRTKKLRHDSEEFIHVVSGSIDLQFGHERHTMRAGDSAYFDSRKEHQVFNDSAEEAVLLNVVFDYRRF